MKKLNVIEWAEQNRVVPDFKTEQLPLLMDTLKTFDQDSSTREIVIRAIQPQWTHLRLLGLLSLLGIEVEDEEAYI